jgi:hypothetical protein
MRTFRHAAMVEGTVYCAGQGLALQWRTPEGAHLFSDFFDWLNHQPQGTASFIGTLAGSTFGFLALLAGALFNARLNRLTDDRLRDHDLFVVATALYAELRLIKEMMLANIETLREPNSGDGYFVPLLKVQLLPELLHKIGLLKAEVIMAVTSAYIMIGQDKRELLMLGGETPETAGDEQVWLLKRHGPTLIKMNTVKAGVIDTALKALAPYLK